MCIYLYLSRNSLEGFCTRNFFFPGFEAELFPRLGQQDLVMLHVNGH